MTTSPPPSPRGSTGRLVALLLLGTLIFLVLALVAPWAWQQLHGGTPSAPTASADLPWHIEPQPDGGSRVLGLHLGRTTLAEAGAHWPDEPLKLALVRDPKGRLTLEAYVERVQAGFVQGKVVLTGDADAATLQRWADRATGRDPQPSGAYRLTLHADDEADARRAPVAGLVFLPTARIDEAVAVERFGPPPERLATADGMVHLLYPARGLVISLDPQGRGKPVLQYVAPRDFARLQAPLKP
jgi:hypothetical protein